jgi:FtsP/CotA-like multicopper oxidase with cupredoxin domain
VPQTRTCPAAMLRSVATWGAEFGAVYPPDLSARSGFDRVRISCTCRSDGNHSVSICSGRPWHWAPNPTMDMTRTFTILSAIIVWRPPPPRPLQQISYMLL